MRFHHPLTSALATFCMTLSLLGSCLAWYTSILVPVKFSTLAETLCRRQAAPGLKTERFPDKLGIVITAAKAGYNAAAYDSLRCSTTK